MEVLVILVPLAIALGAIGLAGFLWALKSGQYDDLDGAAWRAIADDEPADDEDAKEAVGKVEPIKFARQGAGRSPGAQAKTDQGMPNLHDQRRAPQQHVGTMSGRR